LNEPRNLKVPSIKRTRPRTRRRNTSIIFEPQTFLGTTAVPAI
jgi:hypothetical protein